MSLFPSLRQGGLVLLLAALCVSPACGDDIFGRHESDGQAALIGIFYDLKQTQDRKPTGVSPADYAHVLEAFFNKGWDEAVLSPYFRTVRSLYTTQIFIPMMSAGEAPKAFDVEKFVRPSVWVAHYKGQVSPPEDGTYRFAAYADDILAVAVDEKTVVIGARFPVAGWKQTLSGVPAGNGFLSFSDWIPLRKDQIIDLDVLIGERPGGTFGGFLLYEKQGAAYPVDANNQPMLPIFQLVKHEMPSYEPKMAPNFFVPPVPWTGHQ